MNREIIFRGKRIDNKEWAYGGIYISGNEVWIFTNTWKTAMAGKIMNHTAQAFKVDPETVGQFTGLKDCNGKEIYEGDVLRSANTNRNWFRRIITFENGEFGYRDKTNTWNGLHEWINKYQFEVIGNIYENPELLTIGQEVRQ